jgi:hypothetical protein
LLLQLWPHPLVAAQAHRRVVLLLVQGVVGPLRREEVCFFCHGLLRAAAAIGCTSSVRAT